MTFFASLYRAVFTAMFIAISLNLSYAQEISESDLPEILKQHVAILASDSLEGRGLGTQGKIIAKNYIANHFEEIGLEPLGDDYFQNFNLRIGLAWVPATNVVGFLEGSDPNLRDEVIVIGAHYDHLGYRKENGERILYPGADDNASGTASLMELARYFSENPDKTPRSLVFIAFDAEESGLHGAYHFVRDSTYFDLSRVKAMFSVDMVGMYETNGGLDLKGIASVSGGREMARKIASDLDINLKNTSADIERRTDTWPFGIKGIPAIHPFTGTVSPYHQPGDKYHLLEYEGMAKLQYFLRDLVSEMSAMPEIKPSRAFLSRFSEEHRSFVRLNSGFTVHQGTGHHRYPSDFFKAKSVYNFAGGFFLQMHFGSFLTLQPEVLYDFNGSQTTNGRFLRHSLTIPVNLQFNIPLDEDFARPFVFTGAYYRYHFTAKDDGESLSFPDDISQDEWGLNFGVGIEIMSVYVAWTYRRGLTDIFDSQTNPSIRDRNSLLSVGYRF